MRRTNSALNTIAIVFIPPLRSLANRCLAGSDRPARSASRRRRRRDALRAGRSEPARHLFASDRSGGMNTIAIVFNAEFVRRIRSRAYLAGTLIGAVGILTLTLLPTILGGMTSSSSKKLVLVGDPALSASVKKALARDFDVTAVLARLDATPTAAFLDAHGKAAAVAIVAASRASTAVTSKSRASAFFTE